MFGEDLKWFFGAVIGLLSLFGGWVVRDRQVMQAIRDADDKLHDRISKQNERITSMSDRFVRREDLDVRLNQISDNLEQVRLEQRETNKRIDAVLSNLKR